MNVFERIQILAKGKDKSLQQIAEDLGFSKNLFYRWKTSSPKGEDLAKVANYFNVSTDYLLGRTEKKYFELTSDEKKDIAEEADEILAGIKDGTNFNFYGEPATPEQLERIRVALTTAMEMNKEEAKKKFTPKKYRD
ncbi:prophage ps1 protein 15 [Listeria fleischmannii 1991]|nr:helix-turn-helix transcriptional regulator [Listeria fleischmannii]EMG27502.1 Phage transcriptional regulator, Cro/CI family protein [Listeria fleischmannii subsp. fleischmannii LU2006-1]KMT60994.1 prophage ps1 protein 15 [Listeria fleischmannii 1991]